MKTITVEDLTKAGASASEARGAVDLFNLLRPALRRNQESGRFDILGGDKTELGLFRTVKRCLGENPEEARGAVALFELLHPALKVNRTNARVDLSTGEKTILGLYEAVKGIIEREG